MSTRTTQLARASNIQRRKHPRCQVKTKITFQKISGGNDQAAGSKMLRGILLNLSQGGMLLLTRKPLQPDDFLAVNLEVSGLSKFSNVVGKIKRVEKQKNEYLAGVEFCQLAEFYQGLSLRRAAKLPNGLDSFEKKFTDALLRRQMNSAS
jgi:c-di-GMP-binding flagellar brake protein YcgR